MREKLLSHNDAAAAPLPVPEWDMPKGLFVRQWTLEERREVLEIFEDWDKAKADKTLYTKSLAHIVALSLSGADGKPIFSKEDEGQLAAKNGVVIERIVKAALHHNKVSNAGVEEAKKNSEAAPSSTSLSPSPGPSAAPSAN